MPYISNRTKYRILVAVALEGSPLSRVGEIRRVLGILSRHPNLRWAKDFISAKKGSVHSHRDCSISRKVR